LMPSGNMCPIFSVSSVSKTGYSTLIDFIWRL
jgi:GTPase